MSIITSLFSKALKTKKLWISVVLVVVILLILWFRYCPKSDDQIINDFVEKANIDDAVGQLFMVGLPSDHLNYKNSQEMEQILKHVGVGFVITNTYNYYSSPQEEDVDKYLTSILDFNKNIQSLSMASHIKVPVLIATDFEGHSYSSLNKGFLLPPSALSLSASRKKDFISAMGHLSGNQLRNAGIDIILGPVLDTYNVKQGNRSTLQDRCFASSTEGVVNISSHYIKGLRESGIAIFAKHFPSYGFVETNPHQPVIPVYDGSTETLSQEIKMLSKLKNTLDGLMTSHIKLSYLDNAEIATFSKEFIEKQLKKNGFNSQIIITDDLSSMGAIQKYLEENKGDDFSTLAIKAFEAGHDVLLFAHFPSSNSKSRFTIADLEVAKKRLSDHIKMTNNTDRFKESLKKIIKLKVRIAKRNGKSIEDVLEIGKTRRISTIVEDGKELREQSEIFLKEIGHPDIDTGEKLIHETIKSATVLINKGAINYVLPSDKNDLRILFCINEDFVNLYKNAFGSLFTKAKFISIPQIKNDLRFQQARQKIISLFDESDIIIYTVSDKSDSDLLSFLESHKKNFSNKAIIFSHCNPIIFDINVLRKATIITYFTNHPSSYRLDIDLLSNVFPPKPLLNLPISIGENGKFYNVEKTEWIEPASELLDAAPQIRRTDRFKDDCKSYIEEDSILFPKRIFSYVLLLFWIIVCYFINLILKKWWFERRPENPKDASTRDWLLCFFAEHHRITATLSFLLLPVMFILIKYAPYIYNYLLHYKSMFH